MFDPVEKPRNSDDWADAIEASQFPAQCGRFLLVRDDFRGSGLGWTARMFASALLLAMRQSRVLLEIPVWHGSSRDARWCRQPPYTLQCFYRAWSHCKPPLERALSYEERCEGHNSSRTRGWQDDESSGFGQSRRIRFNPNCHSRHWSDPVPFSRFSNIDVLSVRLSTIHTHSAWWAGPGNDAHNGDFQRLLASAHRFLFGSPRPWVRELAACTMARANLQAGQFLSVHVRLSPEKTKEQGKHGVVVVEAYSLLVQALLNASTAMRKEHPSLASGLHQLFLQTANPDALGNFTQLLTMLSGGGDRAARVSFTDNPRHIHDTWGGWVDDAYTITQQTTVGVVNAHIARQAAMLISPSNSVWTAFLKQMMSTEFGSRAADELVAVSYKCNARKPGVGRTQGYLRIYAHPRRIEEGLAKELLFRRLRPAMEAAKTAMASAGLPVTNVECLV